MAKRESSVAVPDWQDPRAAPVGRATAPAAAAAIRLEIGQRFYRVGLPSVVWRVWRVYRDGRGLEHAILESNHRDLDPKTLSAAVLLDSRQYRSVRG